MTPRDCSGLAVTGPTAAATMQPEANRASSRSVTPSASAADSQAWAPGAEVKTTASISPSAAARTEAARATGSGGGPQRYTTRLATTAPAAASSVSRPSAPAPWCCTAIRCPATPSASSRSRISAEVSDSATQSACSPAAWIAPRALGPRATIRAPRSTSTSSSARPAASAASTHPRNPMPVVTTTVSGGAASRSLVSSSSCSSCSCGTMLSAGAWRTIAPRRDRAEPSSPERRSAVTSTTQPLITCPRGWLMRYPRAGRSRPRPPRR